MRLLTRRLRERDRQYELMSADAIVGSIAHEIRQPLAAIATNAGAALRFLENKAPDYNEVRDALRGYQRKVTELVMCLMGFAPYSRTSTQGERASI